ncbi:MAG: hypothetical protein D6747_02095 [Chlorobiota bacterium]|jgi:hypothetical protein|nr:MAG: hypothetical protein D6747_02095 [Chlorobiota bacterium]
MKRFDWAAIAGAVIAVVVVGTIVLALDVETPTIPRMRTVDVFDTTLANGFRWVIATVETNRYDSGFTARYATMLYHRLIPKHLDDTGAVQLELYVVNPDDRQRLRPEDIAMLTRNNPAIVDRLTKLEVVDSGYVAVRFSTPWMLFGRDTLMVLRTRLYVPGDGYRWASVIRRPAS